MIDILEALRDTPLPSILVIGGILFLLLSFVRIVGSNIELEPAKTWLVGVIGIILLCSGVGMYLIPAIQPLATSSTKTPISESPTQVNQPTSIAQSSSPSPTTQIPTSEAPVIISTSAPVSIGEISIAGNSSEGTKFTAPQAGVYTFKYISGSYSTYPASKTPPAGTLTWLTAIRVFKNRLVEWNGIAVSNSSDYRAVDYAYYASASEVESIAKGSVLTVSLLQGDYLIFVAVDELPYYSDNPGEVIFEVLYAPNQ